MRSTTSARVATSKTKRPKRAVRAGAPRMKNEEVDAAVGDGERGAYEIRSVTRALELLEAISESVVDDAIGSDDEVRISCLSQRLGMSKSVVFRLLATLETRGYVEHARESGIYRIGMNAFELGRKLLTRMVLLQQSRPVMEDLCRRCNEAIYLALRRGSEFLFIELVESAQQVKIATLVGRRFPLSKAAPGQLLLAYADNADLAAMPDKAAIRRKGYHYEQGGLGEMVSCLAAPFFNNFGAVAGALCVVGPAFRMSETQVDAKFWPLLKDASNAISSKLGYLEPYAGRVRL